jgi:hypothetical protein
MTRTFARRFARNVGLPAVLAISIAGAACIQKNTRSVMYLDPGGSVTWSILESDVHSDSTSPDDRASDEQGYRRELGTNPAPLVAVLESLGGRGITRSVLKDTAPFEVHTVARFDRVDGLFEAVCQAGGIRCVSHTSWEGRRTRLTVEQVGKIESEADPVALTDALDHLQVVLAEGRFVEAVGFTLKNDRTAALNDDLDEDHLVLSLTWEVTGR